MTNPYTPRGWPLSAKIAHYTAPANSEGCRLWTGGIFKQSGYGKLWWRGRSLGAHRLAYENAHGLLQGDHLVVRHKCDVRLCVNVDHLEVGTQADNIADRDTRGRQARGERHGKAKHSEATIRAVKAASGSHAQIAERYGVAQTTVSYVKRGMQWGHLS